jgi:hypothetical protein
MKAEHRKALQTNTLAQELTRVVEGIKKGPSRSTLFWLALFAVGLGIFFTFRYFWRQSEATASQRWLEYDEVVFPEQLSSFVKNPELTDTQQGRLGRYKEARYKLGKGLRDLGANPTAALEDIRAGTELYEQLLKETARVDLLIQEALWGAAKGREALDELDDARKNYERLAKEYPASELGKDAKKQLERLDSPEGKRDIRDLAKALAPTKK